jgi:hypothetical protein
VTAVGQRVSVAAEQPKNADGSTPAPEQIRSVTLIVTPDQAEAVELSTMSGRPRLVLRGNGDKTTSETIGVTVAELVGRNSSKPDIRQVSTSQPSAANVVQAVMTRIRPTTRPSDDFDQKTIEVIRAAVPSNVTLKVEKPRQVEQDEQTQTFQGVRNATENAIEQ